jgi:HK97 family phage prohead protease
VKATRTLIRGYLVPWGDLARLPDGTMEQPRRGAFAESVARVSEANPLPLDFEHDSIGLNGPRRVPIGIIVGAKEDRTGLLVDIRPHQSQDAQDVVEAIRSGALRGMSATWSTESAKYEPLNKQNRRVLTAADLTGGAITGSPAYRATRAWIETEEYDDGSPEPGTATVAAPAAQGDPR